MKEIIDSDDDRLMPKLKNIIKDWQRGKRYIIETGDVIGAIIFCGVISGSAHGSPTVVFNMDKINYYYPLSTTNPEHTRHPPLVQFGKTAFYVVTK